jgi:Glycosyltransferase
MILIFGHYPIEEYQTILLNSKSGAQFAADALQWSFITGFEENNILPKIINLPYIGSFPKRYSKLFYETNKLCYTFNNNTYASYKFCNLSLYKMISRYYVTKKSLFNDFNNKHNTQTLVIYSVSTPFLKAAIDYKRKFALTKICVIVADLPEFMSDSKNILYRLLKNIDGNNVNKYLRQVDAFVLLSENMKERLPINNKPYVVVEGIYNKHDEVDNFEEISNVKQILYSGTLAYRYGIMNLVHAFSKIKNDNYRLVICGDGDSKEEIIELSQKDSRINYLGSLKREEVLKLQKQSSLLVNPRTPEGEFTKYSFPSKTMEYLASGTPTLLYKLPGIPDEYYNFCFTVEKLGIDELAYKIDEILSKSDKELKEIGDKAREFILEKKNPKVQCAKVIDMINQLCSG